jgi:hypothetical protein
MLILHTGSGKRRFKIATPPLQQAAGGEYPCVKNQPSSATMLGATLPSSAA